VINVMGEAEPLVVECREYLGMYRPVDEPLESYFCDNCGSHLYVVLPD
jgi:hypothetical protein